MTPDEQAARQRGFTAGFAVACAELAGSHMESDLAKMLLTEAGISLDAMRSAGVDDADVETLRAAIETN